MSHTAATTGSPPPLALLVHELRAPLAAIVGMADAMAGETLGPLPAAYAEYARLIHRTGEHALALVAALNEAGPTSGEPGDAAGAVVADVADAVRPGLEAAGLCLRLDLAVDAAAFRVPGRALRQILFNLLDNARKFAGAGGQIVVRLSAEAGRVSVEVANPGRVGDALAKDPSPPGSGLGLGVVRAICAAHGGGFRLETTPAGATATAWLATSA